MQNGKKELQFNYTKPKENNSLGEGYVHKIELKNNLGGIGYAELIYKKTPIPFYYISFLNIKNEFRGMGYGKKILEEIHSFLIKKGKTGILKDEIEKINPNNTIVKFYESNGWIELPYNSWMIFNPIQSLTGEKYSKIIYGIEKTLDKQFN